jgi:hypothetical protein
MILNKTEEVKHIVNDLQHTRLVMSHDCVDKMLTLAKKFRQVNTRKNQGLALKKSLEELDSFVSTKFKPDKFNVRSTKATTDKRLKRLATSQRRVATKVLREYRKTIDASKFDVESLASILDNTAKHLEFATRIYEGDIESAKQLDFDKSDIKRIPPRVLHFVNNVA